MLTAKVHKYIGEHRLIAAGDRVSVAVSGGADSVALLRILVELRAEIGIGLSVAHFNHRIRGEEANADEQFVQDLAQEFGLEMHCGSGDVPAYARERRLSVETAARELRHEWFAGLIKEQKADKIATAHNQDDQAETVLMRILRGAGSRGLAGIAPRQASKALIRPLLAITRREIEVFLKELKQPWREDCTNRDLQHTRNRIRHELLPHLSREYNPAIGQTLADLAEVARAEESYWEQELGGLMARLVRSGKPSRSGRSNGQQLTLAVDLSALLSVPEAARRRLLRAMSERFGVALEFKHVQELLRFVEQPQASKLLELPGGLSAHRSLRELQFRRPEDQGAVEEYCYSLSVPGTVEVVELGAAIRAQVITAGAAEELSGYNSSLLSRALLAPQLQIRNWRPGDRFFPAHTRSPKKVKELLQAGRFGRQFSANERKSWPVIESRGEIVWMRGFPAPQAFALNSGEAVLIEEISLLNEQGS